MGAQWIDYKGKKILYVQYTGLKAPEMLGLIKTASEMIVAAKSNQVLSLTDVTDCFVNQEFLDLSKKQSAITLQYTKKAAIIGIVGLKKVLLNGLNAFTSNPRVPFDTLQQAKDWLVA